MRCITTAYLGSTNTRGARVKATGYDCHTTVSWDYARSVHDNHQRAARTLAVLNGWTHEGAELPGGVLPSSNGYAFLVPVE